MIIKYIKNLYRDKPNGGFMALTATLILMAVLMILMASNSTASYFARFDALGNEFKRTSLGLSEACVNKALFEIAQDYDYTPPASPLILDNGYECSIEVEYDNETSSGKTARIKARAEYEGAWSTNEITATIKNPEFTATATPPACALSVSDDEISSGQEIELVWITSNATDFDVEALTNSSAPVDYNNLALPNGSIDDLDPTESTTYVGIATGANGVQVQCVASVSVQQSIGECAEIVMMLDRTGSMNSTDLTNERIAAKGLLDLLKDVFPIPKVGVGRFGTSSSNSSAQIQNPNPNGQLTSTYGDDDSGNDSDNDLYHAIEQATTSGSAIYTNLKSAISVADSELNSSRHTPDKKKVLILISDGEPNRPCSNGTDSCGSSVTQFALDAAEDAADDAKDSHGVDNLPTNIFAIHFGAAGSSNTNIHFLASLSTNSLFDKFLTITENTGLRPPANTSSPNGWTTPTNAFNDNNQYATATANNAEQGYRDFGLTVPSGQEISDIEVVTRAYVFAPSPSLISDTFGTGGSTNDISGWDEEGSDNDSSTLAQASSGSGEDSASPNGGRFAKIGEKEWMCRVVDATGSNNLALSYQWRGDAQSNDTNDDGIVEYIAGSGNCDVMSGWIPLQNHDMRTDTTWSSQASFALPPSLNNTTFRLRFRNSNNGNAGNEYFRVDNVLLSSSVPAVNPSCELEVAISPNAGADWYTSNTSPTLTNGELSYTYGSGGDDWGRTWTSGDFSNTNFRAKVRYIDPDPGSNTLCTDNATMRLDAIQVRVYYDQISTTPDADAENGDGDHFFIAPTSADMDEVFQTVGELACPALASPEEPEEPPEAPEPPEIPQPVDIESWNEIINT